MPDTSAADSVTPVSPIALPQAETRARRRIREAVESRGYRLVSLEWEPWSNGGEKSGICGGWHGETDRPFLKRTYPGNDIWGLSVDEVIASIDDFVEPPEPCGCPSTDESAWRSPVPMSHHLDLCRWHLRYWLSWWPFVPTGGAE